MPTPIPAFNRQTTDSILIALPYRAVRGLVFFLDVNGVKPDNKDQWLSIEVTT